MTFLNPFVLFGLAAATIPVILHLLNLRKLRTIEFSTLTFLKQLQQTKIRRLKLRQLLLLIIRTLLVVFIVLAFARPALRGTILGTIGAHARSSIVFVVDDSFSLTVSDEHGERLKQLKDAMSSLIDLMKEGDEAFLIKLSDLPNATIEPAVHDFTILQTAVREMTASSVRRPMEQAIRLAARLLTQSKNANKEVYLISDMQRTLFMQPAGQSPDILSSLFDERAKIFTVAIGSKAIGNASIDSVEVRSKILEKDKPVKIFASVRNFSQLPLKDYVVSVFLDGVRAAQTNASIEPFGSASVEFTITPKHAGDLKGYVELENDAIEQDNRRYFSLQIPDHINITIVGTSPSVSQYVVLALTSNAANETRSFFHIDEVAEGKFTVTDLKHCDVLLLSGVRTFSSSDAERIKAFAAQGRGVMIFPGDHIDLNNYNQVLLSLLQIPAIEQIVKVPPGQSPMTIQKVDFDHPLFETMFEKDARGRRITMSDIESPSIMTALQRQAGKHGRILISLSEGGAFLSEHAVGQGKILFFSVAPTLGWSDFPLKGIFAPLVYRSVVFAASGNEGWASYTAGDAPTVVVRNYVRSAGGETFKLVAPDGVEELLQPIAPINVGADFLPGKSFALKPLAMAGTYDLRAGNTHVASIVVNLDKFESDTRLAAGEDLALFWKRLHVPDSSIQTLEQSGQLQLAVLRSRFGVELWKYCIGAALLLALLEMLVARDSRRAMQGAAA